MTYMSLETDIQSRDAQLLAEAAEILRTRVDKGAETGISRAAAEQAVADADNYARLMLEKQKQEEQDLDRAKREEEPQAGIAGLLEFALSLLAEWLGKNVAEEDAARARAVTLGLTVAAEAIDALNAERQAQGGEPLGFDEQMRLIASSRIGFSAAENEYSRERFGEALDALRQPENPDRESLGNLSPSLPQRFAAPLLRER